MSYPAINPHAAALAELLAGSPSVTDMGHIITGFLRQHDRFYAVMVADLIREKVELAAVAAEVEDLRKQVEVLESMVPEANDDLIRASWMRRKSPEIWEGIGRMAAAERGQDIIAESVRATSDPANR